jgi:hypothetical protein
MISINNIPQTFIFSKAGNLKLGAWQLRDLTPAVDVDFMGPLVYHNTKRDQRNENDTQKGR